MNTEKVIAYCPACGEQNEATVAAMRAGVNCLACGVGFVPEKVDVLANVPSVAALPKVPPRNLVREQAVSVSMVAKICFVLFFLITGFWAWASFGSGDAFSAIPLLVATGFLMLGFWLQVVAQLMFIRAAIEEKN